MNLFFRWRLRCNRRGLPPYKDDILDSAQNIIKADVERKTPFTHGRR